MGLSLEMQDSRTHEKNFQKIHIIEYSMETFRNFYFIIQYFLSQKTDFEQMTLKTQEIRGSFHIGNDLNKRVISQEIALILAK